jgi:hypothetical protein
MSVGIVERDVLPNSEKPWPVPAGWAWATLGAVANNLDYKRIPVNAKERAARCAGKKPTELFPYYGATYASPCGPAMLVTQDPNRTSAQSPSRANCNPFFVC